VKISDAATIERVAEILREVCLATLARGTEQAPWPPRRTDGYTEVWPIVTDMWGWVLIVILYVAGMGFFYWLGGIGAAAEAIQQWGQAFAERRRRTSSSNA
jgi:hypothetical protein